ncbi:MAG: hypothetical protein EXS13_04100 [Planctomycetes bacterium]|nr:hypothetical protein [Planctomycetota bacterium]
MEKLLDAPAVYSRFFAPWLRPIDRERRGTELLRPDLLEVAAFRFLPATELSTVAPDVSAKVADQIGRMVAAARTDWKELCGRHDVTSREGLGAIDAGFDADAIAELHSSSDPAEFGNSLLVTVCELGAVIGTTLCAARPTLQWVADWPYFESTLVDRATGIVLPPFHWAIRKLSAEGAGGGMVERIGVVLTHLAGRTAELSR